MAQKGSSFAAPGLSQYLQLLREGRKVFTRGDEGGLQGITAVTKYQSSDSSQYPLHSTQMGRMPAPVGSNENVNANMQPDAGTSPQAIPALLSPLPEGPYVFQTVSYKSIGNTIIRVNIYKPYSQSGSRTPIMLYIHGGGWVGGNRIDCSQLLLGRFLQCGFVIYSMDYRLLPESSFDEMQEDVRDIEPWLRQRFQAEVAEDVHIDDTKIVVVGASAGALLALLTVGALFHSPIRLVWNNLFKGLTAALYLA